MVVVDIYTAGRAHFSSVQYIRRIAIRSYSIFFVVAHIITTLTDDWIVYIFQGVSIVRIVERGTTKIEIGKSCLNIAGNLCAIELKKTKLSLDFINFFRPKNLF